MAFLVIAGVTVEYTALEEGETIYNGDEARTFGGNLRNIASGSDKKEWTATVDEISNATLTTLRSAIANGAHISITGDALGSITARVKIVGAPFLRDGTGFLRTATLRITEV